MRKLRYAELAFSAPRPSGRYGRELRCDSTERQTDAHCSELELEPERSRIRAARDAKVLFYPLTAVLCYEETP